MEYHLTFSHKILSWSKNAHIPKLPWQINKTIYKIWISEVMLQQTQVATVIPYYQKFIKKFPTISKLAEANINEILYIWSGLGYYKRALNLHKTATIIIHHHNGVFPNNFNILLSFPGIGRSTAGAILSLALNKRFPILDGNIKRILIRYYSLNNQQTSPTKINNKLWSLIDSLLPLDSNYAIFNQAMMDLGRLICTQSNPQCNICPLNSHCQSFLTNNINLLTQKYATIHNPKQKKIIYWLILLVKHRNIIYLTQRLQETIWNKLFCFPEFYNRKTLNTWLSKYNLHNNLKINMPTIKHNISNIALEIQPTLININNTIFNTNEKNIWYNLNKPAIIGLPKPVNTILKIIQNKTI